MAVTGAITFYLENGALLSLRAAAAKQSFCSTGETASAAAASQ